METPSTTINVETAIRYYENMLNKTKEHHKNTRPRIREYQSRQKPIDINKAVQYYANCLESSKNYQRLNRDKLSIIQKRYYQNIMADPVRRQVYLDKKKAYYHRKALEKKFNAENDIENIILDNIIGKPRTPENNDLKLLCSPIQDSVDKED